MKDKQSPMVKDINAGASQQVRTFPDFFRKNLEYDIGDSSEIRGITLIGKLQKKSFNLQKN